MIKSATFSGIVRVDAKATRHLDGLDVWHMEVAGPSDNASDDHIIGDAKKSLRTDLLNLIAILKNHLDCDVNVATKIKVLCTQAVKTRLTLYALNMLPDGRFLATELASAVIPFSFSGRSNYISILRMMAIFHDEIEKRETLMEEINCRVLRSIETTVRQGRLGIKEETDEDMEIIMQIEQDHKIIEEQIIIDRTLDIKRKNVNMTTATIENTTKNDIMEIDIVDDMMIIDKEEDMESRGRYRSRSTYGNNRI
ncbi:hypothetical protein C1646_673131 [Rhizophagus diaphanus]|nr:hypothetical protein C1646_673131 [Rhizophagus diaphanus] [Rhizophagus sp. MUCL 43196]